MAQQMAQNVQQAQQELDQARVEGTAGGGVVKAVVTGKPELVSLTIDPSAVDPNDAEMLQDLVVAAINDALRAAETLRNERMGALTGGMNIPGLF
jgi:DNA-binding YbaB/EbfC family protein